MSVCPYSTNEPEGELSACPVSVKEYDFELSSCPIPGNESDTGLFVSPVSTNKLYGELTDRSVVTRESVDELLLFPASVLRP